MNLPITNASTARGQVKRLLRGLETPIITPLDGHPPRKRGPAYRQAKRALEKQYDSHNIGSAEVGEGKALTFYLLALVPTEASRMGVRLLSVEYRDPHFLSRIDLPIVITRHVLERLMQRLITTEWSVIADELADAINAVVVGDLPPNGQIELPTTFGVMRAARTEGTTTFITWIRKNDDTDRN
jgi:hypothetical protein